MYIHAMHTKFILLTIFTPRCLYMCLLTYLNFLPFSIIIIIIRASVLMALEEKKTQTQGKGKSEEEM